MGARRRTGGSTLSRSRPPRTPEPTSSERPDEAAGGPSSGAASHRTPARQRRVPGGDRARPRVPGRRLRERQRPQSDRSGSPNCIGSDGSDPRHRRGSAGRHGRGIHGRPAGAPDLRQRRVPDRDRRVDLERPRAGLRRRGWRSFGSRRRDRDDHGTGRRPQRHPRRRGPTTGPRRGRSGDSSPSTTTSAAVVPRRVGDPHGTQAVAAADAVPRLLPAGGQPSIRNSWVESGRRFPKPSRS